MRTSSSSSSSPTITITMVVICHRCHMQVGKLNDESRDLKTIAHTKAADLMESEAGLISDLHRTNQKLMDAMERRRVAELECGTFKSRSVFLSDSLRQSEDKRSDQVPNVSRMLEQLHPRVHHTSNPQRNVPVFLIASQREPHDMHPTYRWSGPDRASTAPSSAPRYCWRTCGSWSCARIRWTRRWNCRRFVGTRCKAGSRKHWTE